MVCELQLCSCRSQTGDATNRVAISCLIATLFHRWPASKVAILQSLRRIYCHLQGVSLGPNGTLFYAIGMRSRALYTWNKITCLRIFRLFVAQRATGQRRPPLKIQTGRLMLPAHRWKRPLQLITCREDTNGSSFTTANKHLFANLLLFESGEGDEATSPSFAAKNASIDASSSSLEAPIATYYMQRGMRMGGIFTTADKYLSTDLLFFTAREGDEATSPSFIAENAGIEASSVLLEALIAT